MTCLAFSRGVCVLAGCIKRALEDRPHSHKYRFDCANFISVFRVFRCELKFLFRIGPCFPFVSFGDCTVGGHFSTGTGFRSSEGV